MSTPTGSKADVPGTAPSDLDREVDHAKLALSRTWAELKAAITGADPASGGGAGGSALTGASDKLTQLAADHPYYTLAGATAAGFLAAAVFVPSKEQSVLKKLAALERAVALHGRDVEHEKPGKGLTGTLLASLTGVLKPALLHAITASLAAKTAADVNEPTPPSDGAPSDGVPSDGHPSRFSDA